MSTTNTSSETESDTESSEDSSAYFSQENLNPETEEADRIDAIIDGVNGDSFDDWYAEKQRTENIFNNKSYYNEPGYVAPPEKVSPHKLLQCQRKVTYNSQNTPVETEQVDGIFWFGTQFENEVAVPYLQSVAHDINPNNYVTQDMRINYHVERNGVDLHIKGETDPVIVDRRGAPLVVTEVKTTGYLDKYRGDDATPSRRHKAQIHAYMAGLNEEYERDITQGIIVYGGKKTFDMVAFHVEFDEEFWTETVLEWASTQTQHRLDETLPPDDPEEDWECKYCDFKTRCGKNSGDSWEHIGVDGFVPLTQYPETQAKEYLQAESSRDAKLTPTLAYQHPELVEEGFDVFDWECDECGSQYDWDRFDWDGNAESPPTCTNDTCLERYGNLPLRGPLPSTQLSSR